ncbi:MAG TPA: hypothetical protein VL989_02160 [Candidatus Sulfotelmatobacter sp.]|nr:hypothetical protein [Candidatus Sulfotelmatobacter sp.]
MPLPTSKRSHFTTKILASLILVIGAVSLIYVNRYSIFDWWRLRNYHTPTQVQALINDDTMTPLGATLFKINYPSIESVKTFTLNCPNNDIEQSLVLGCYHPVQEGIFLLNVNTPALNGVMQVTAAHEMLHAAYDRLSASQKTNVDNMLLSFYKHDVHSTVIINEVNIYKKTEPGEVLNEMNSTFGTEIAALPADLNKYYSQYFYDRQKITSYAASYQGALLTRQSQVNADDNLLTRQKAQIDALENELNARLASINSLQTQLSALKSSGNVTEYNAGVPGYNALVSEYNSQAAQLQTQINQYNDLVASRNSVALTENQLYQALSGNPQPIK